MIHLPSYHRDPITLDFFYMNFFHKQSSPATTWTFGVPKSSLEVFWPMNLLAEDCSFFLVWMNNTYNLLISHIKFKVWFLICSCLAASLEKKKKVFYRVKLKAQQIGLLFTQFTRANVKQRSRKHPVQLLVNEVCTRSRKLYAFKALTFTWAIMISLDFVFWNLNFSIFF